MCKYFAHLFLFVCFCHTSTHKIVLLVFFGISLIFLRFCRGNEGINQLWCAKCLISWECWSCRMEKIVCHHPVLYDKGNKIIKTLVTKVTQVEWPWFLPPQTNCCKWAICQWGPETAPCICAVFKCIDYTWINSHFTWQWELLVCCCLDWLDF